MSGEHAHPEYALAEPTAALIATLQTRVEQLAGQVGALEAAHRILEGKVTTLEEPDVIYRYLGKPDGTLTVGGSYTDLDASRWDPPGGGWEHTLVYLNVTPTFKTGKTRGALRVRLMRSNGDTTMYHDHVIDRDALASGSQLITQAYWELGDGSASRIQLKCIGGLAKVVIDTRYTKRALVRD